MSKPQPQTRAALKELAQAMQSGDKDRILAAKLGLAHAEAFDQQLKDRQQEEEKWD